MVSLIEGSRVGVKMPSSSILSDFEWDEGLTMPVANAENKQLEEEVCCRNISVNSERTVTAVNTCQQR